MGRSNPPANHLESFMFGLWNVGDEVEISEDDGKKTGVVAETRDLDWSAYDGPTGSRGVDIKTDDATVSGNQQNLQDHGWRKSKR